jgi:hypothetical protein
MSNGVLFGSHIATIEGTGLDASAISIGIRGGGGERGKLQRRIEAC